MRPASSRSDLISVEYRGFYGQILVKALLQVWIPAERPRGYSAVGVLEADDGALVGRINGLSPGAPHQDIDY